MSARSEVVADSGFSFALSAYKRYRDQLRIYLGRRLARPQDIDDLAQDVYLRLLRVESESEIKEPLAYLYTVAAHAIADHMSVVKREQERAATAGEMPELLFGDSSAAHLGRPEDIVDVEQEVNQALAELPEKQAAVLYLFERDGLSRREIAVKCKLTEDTVKKYLTQARSKVRLKVWKTRRDIPE